MATVPALGELLSRDPTGVRFADDVGSDEQEAIRDWAQANYNPIVQT